MCSIRILDILEISQNVYFENRIMPNPGDDNIWLILSRILSRILVRTLLDLITLMILFLRCSYIPI